MDRSKYPSRRWVKLWSNYLSAIDQADVGRPFQDESRWPYDNPYWEAAQALTRKLGLHANDSIACNDLGCDDTYWARLAGLRVTADISTEADYGEATPADRARAMPVLAGVGVKAIVARHLGAGAESEGWMPLSDPK
jgi:hypothetical protein